MYLYTASVGPILTIENKEYSQNAAYFMGGKSISLLCLATNINTSKDLYLAMSIWALDLLSMRAESREDRLLVRGDKCGETSSETRKVGWRIPEKQESA